VTQSLVGWAIACDDIDRALDEARAAGFDPGDVIDGHRLTPAGTMLRWRISSNARTAGVVSFLISWGDTAHPAASAPSGLRLESLHVEHPDPEWIVRVLRALGTNVDVYKAEPDRPRRSPHRANRWRPTPVAGRYPRAHAAPSELVCG
jgi:Glyoxalase-like domain